MTVKKRFFWITAIIVITAILVVLCVGYFTGNQVSEFDGTLVESSMQFPRLL